MISHSILTNISTLFQTKEAIRTPKPYTSISMVVDLKYGIYRATGLEDGNFRVADLKDSILAVVGSKDSIARVSFHVCGMPLQTEA